jgi:hypothetical protein
VSNEVHETTFLAPISSKALLPSSTFSFFKYISKSAVPTLTSSKKPDYNYALEYQSFDQTRTNKLLKHKKELTHQ